MQGRGMGRKSDAGKKSAMRNEVCERVAHIHEKEDPMCEGVKHGPILRLTKTKTCPSGCSHDSLIQRVPYGQPALSVPETRAMVR